MTRGTDNGLSRAGSPPTEPVGRRLQLGYSPLSIRRAPDGRWVVAALPDWLAAWLGAPPDRLVGQPLTEVLGVAAPELVMLVQQAVLRKASLPEREVIVRTITGEGHRVRMTCRWSASDEVVVNLSDSEPSPVTDPGSAGSGATVVTGLPGANPPAAAIGAQSASGAGSAAGEGTDRSGSELPMETDGVSEAASATRAGAVPRPAWRQTEAGHCLRAGGGLSRVVPGGDRIQGFLGIIGSTPVMLRLYEKIQMYAAVEAPVLITGETGTGKELVARAIHQASSRARRAFVTVNCSALTESLVESELFGHERGSFTGAAQTHRGRFERAHTGTIFLDEIGDMPLNGQAKLLRVLEEGSLERVGGEKPIPIDVRVVAATNVELEAAAAARRFRPDLFYRLEVLRLRLPPLRERLDDIGLLADHFIDRFNEKYGRNVRGITGEALALLASYSWPGNVREFRNLFERVFAEQNVEVLGRRAFQEWAQERAALAHRGALDPRVTLLPFRAAIELPSAAMPEGRSGGETVAAGADQGTILLDPVQVSLSEPVSVPGGISARAGAAGAGWRTGAPPPPIELTAVAIREAFQACGGNLTQAAARLGVHKATLYRRLKALGISRDDLAR